MSPETRRRPCPAAARAGSRCGGGTGGKGEGQGHREDRLLTLVPLVATERRGAARSSGERRRPAGRAPVDWADWELPGGSCEVEEVDGVEADLLAVAAGIGGARNGGEVRRPEVGLGFARACAHRERRGGLQGEVRSGGRGGRTGRPHPLARRSRRWPASHQALPGSCLPVEEDRAIFPITPWVLGNSLETKNSEGFWYF
jgi:hypothetical protein